MKIVSINAWGDGMCDELTDLVGGADTRTAIYTKGIRSASYMLVATSEVSDHRALMLEFG
ncbi:hypothetical protein [Rhodococcus cercidiphylli]|uniref:Uncharacterized protein n=1 Tax=Rhodococcus cercidiphylli TaxID=489916 RepID=A0ABU4B184_9NOCA|nr:hypothetical protein [Rhodococcus cercidiphylli]MDV6232258.1 hypothetical protein [Rhodococcus cercidiphylli]